MSCITTYTGKNFDPLNVDESLSKIKQNTHTSIGGEMNAIFTISVSF